MILYHDLGVMDYKETWEYQEKLFNERVEQKILNRSLEPGQQIYLDDLLLFVEHPHVFTLGKSGDSGNFLIRKEFLETIHATYYHTNRGGDITYHGPGQIVGYPIFDLEHFGMHIKQYIAGLEEVIIQTLAYYGIRATRLSGATGVWLDPGTENARKICAIGVRASRHITMHGFAFNVLTDLSYFDYINPCGFTDKGVTSMEKELGEKPDFESVKLILKEKLISFFSNFQDAEK
ncbi:MAG: lipoyl(octanoyl) transferase LipB [Bacteroidales bacterium]|nr:lipoyl(octanoyl) transferase LipB [Bacteroidales bacterium]